MTDLFKEEAPKEEGKPAVPTEGNDSAKTYLGLILNEQGEQKYENIEEALKGSVHAQSHITKLESEMAELRQKVESGADMNKVLEALQAGKPEGTTSEGDTTTSGISPEELATTIGDIIDNRSTELTHTQNVKSVTDAFRSVYGDKASSTLYEKAENLGFNQEGINILIATNPTAALKLLLPEGSKHVSDPITDSGQRIENLDGKPAEQPETIMGATSHKDLSRAWDASKAATLKRLGIDELT